MGRGPMVTVSPASFDDQFVLQKVAITAGKETSSVELKATSESLASTVTYGPKSATPAP
jgi:hypothetical protein